MLPKRVMNTEAMTTVNMMGFITSNYHPTQTKDKKEERPHQSHCFNDTPTLVACCLATQIGHESVLDVGN